MQRCVRNSELRNTRSTTSTIVAIIAYAFDGSLDNGGDGLKIGIYQLQAAWIAQKEQC